jgi:hypothetical protein
LREQRPAPDERRSPIERDLFLSAAARTEDAASPPVSSVDAGDGGVTIGISMWLVAAVALVLGIVIGFASGFTAGQRATVLSEAFESVPDEPAPAPAPPRSEEPVAAQAFTEGAVTEPVRIDPEPIASASDTPAAMPERPRAAAAPQSRRAVPVEPVASSAGSMQILSRPSGAQVFVDGRVIGRTPLVIPDVRSGSHDVRLELSGFRRWTTSVQVTPGNRTRVAASLEQ